MLVNDLGLDGAKACGLGAGGGCCAYLIFGDTFQCGRESESLKKIIDARVNKDEMTARIRPTHSFPLCQDQRAELAQ